MIKGLTKEEVKKLLVELNYLSSLSKSLVGPELMNSNMITDINKAQLLLDNFFALVTIPDETENVTARRSDICGLMKVLMNGIHGNETDAAIADNLACFAVYHQLR